MDATAVTAYLDRIGAPRPAVLDAAALGALHLAHQLTVPVLDRFPAVAGSWPPRSPTDG
jgi:arylamine N-acetyltransferase